MGQSTVTRDSSIFQGTATSGGGTFTATLDTTLAEFTDKVVRIKCTVFLSNATGGHLAHGASFFAEYVVENANGTVTAVNPVASSGNPLNSNSAVNVGAQVQAGDSTVYDTSTAVFTISSNKVVMTVTNAGSSASVNCNVTVIMDYDLVGST